MSLGPKNGNTRKKGKFGIWAFRGLQTWKSRKHEKHYKIRGFSSLGAFKLQKAKPKNLTEKGQRQKIQNPPSKPTSDNNTFWNRRFGHFGRQFENGPDEARNTIKIGVSEKLGECYKRQFRDRGVKRETGPRYRRIWSPKWPVFDQVILDWVLPLKALRSAAGSVFWDKKAKEGPNSPPTASLNTYLLRGFAQVMGG